MSSSLAHGLISLIDGTGVRSDLSHIKLVFGKSLAVLRVRRRARDEFHEGSARSQSRVSVNIYTGKTGLLIGQKGAGVEQIRSELKKLTGLPDIRINIHEVKKVDLDATLVAEGIAFRLEKRESFRRTMKKFMGNVMRSGAKGVKIMVSGRLDGAEIARSEQYHEGSIPLQTLRADIDYGFAEAHTTFGVIGVKVWIYKGEVLPSKSENRSKAGGNDNVNA